MSIVEPKIRGFICTTAHPAGCQAHVDQWIDYIKNHKKVSSGPKKVLVIGGSTGFGLASRVVAAFGSDAATIGVFFERPAANKRTASAGWYNTAAFEKRAKEAGIYAKSINGDAFSDEIKEKTINLIKEDWQGEIDLVIYSIASPRRTHPKTKVTYNSALKPIGKSFKNKTVDVHEARLAEVSLDPASEEEIEHTVAVMGGEDWVMWMKRLVKENLLAKEAKTVAFTYIGPELTHDIYRKGTIGKAKEDLEASQTVINKLLAESVQGHAYISVNKALVTQASAAIPVVPLYISLLYRVMKEKNIHEGCVEQMYRLFAERLYTQHMPVDDKGRIRLDDWEMREDVQAEVARLWGQVNQENLTELSDLTGYLDDFYHLFGFRFNSVDYTKSVDTSVSIDSLEE